MKRRMVSLAVMAVCAVLMSSCATTTIVDEAATLVPGVTTMQDAEARMGPADSRTQYADGEVLLQWMKISAYGPGGHVAILFGPDGRMIRIHHQARI